MLPQAPGTDMHSGNITVNTVSVKVNKATCTKSVFLDSEKPFLCNAALSLLQLISFCRASTAVILLHQKQTRTLYP